MKKLFFFVFVFSLVFLDQSLKIWVFFNQDVLVFPGWWWEKIPFFDIIYLENVRAIIMLQNSDYISIKSNYAKYNTKSFNTLFNNSVAVDYGEHVLKSEFLDLSFENNLVSIYDNVRYVSGISSLSADKAEIDILNKKTKIFMESPNKKVQINNISENGNN